MTRHDITQHNVMTTGARSSAGGWHIPTFRGGKDSLYYG